MGDVHAGHNTSLKVSGGPVTVTGQPMTLIAGTSGKTWQISDLAKDIWDPTQSITVYSGGGAVSASSYEIDYLHGLVIFDTDRSGETITVDVSYLPHYYIPMGKAVTWNASHNALDATVFFDVGERVKLGQRTLEATVEHIDTDRLPLDGDGGSEQTLDQIFEEGQRLVLENGVFGTTDGTKSGARQGKVRRAWVKITEDSKSLTLGELVGSELSFRLNSVSAAAPGQSASHVSSFHY